MTDMDFESEKDKVSQVWRTRRDAIRVKIKEERKTLE